MVAPGGKVGRWVGGREGLLMVSIDSYINPSPFLTLNCKYFDGFNNSRRQGIEEVLNHTDDSSETIINYLVEYVAVRDTLQSIKRKVK